MPIRYTAGRVRLASRQVNHAERYLLENYQDLLRPAERMVARSLVAADFDLHGIPKTVWNRIWQEFPGIDREDPWRLPIEICIRLLNDHRDQIHIPTELRTSKHQNDSPA